jgi:hypothetical protein
VAGLSLALPLAAACGPSFQAIYEGNARFEHCYALEENAQTPMPEKADCWRDWSERYTYGQTRDRIHYATARYVALSQVDAVPTDEAMMMAAPGMTPRQTTITAPAPTNAFAPPPKVLDEADSGAPLRPNERRTVLGHEVDGGVALPSGPRQTPEPREAPLPGADCGTVCGRSFHDCSAPCAAGGDAGAGSSAGDAGAAASVAAGAAATKKKDACASCEKQYRACMRGCFK